MCACVDIQCSASVSHLKQQCHQVESHGKLRGKGRGTEQVHLLLRGQTVDGEELLRLTANLYKGKEEKDLKGAILEAFQLLTPTM